MLSKKAAKSYAYNLVCEGKFCFNQLNEIERSKLTGLLLEITPIIHSYEYISDADSKCEIPYLLGKFLETGNTDLSNEIISLLKTNAVNSMSNRIDELLKEQEEEYNFDIRSGNNE